MVGLVKLMPRLLVIGTMQHFCFGKHDRNIA